MTVPTSNRKLNLLVPKNDGFTLIEGIIVFSLISLLFSFSFPTLAHLRCSLIGKTVTQKIAGQLRIAKIDALNHGRTTKVVFDIAKNKYIYTDSSGKSTHYLLPDEVILYRTNFPLNTLRFYSTGTPSCGGTITLRIGNHLKYIIITPVTGRVRISDKPPS